MRSCRQQNCCRGWFSEHKSLEFWCCYGLGNYLCRLGRLRVGGNLERYGVEAVSSTTTHDYHGRLELSECSARSVAPTPQALRIVGIEAWLSSVGLQLFELEKKKHETKKLYLKSELFHFRWYLFCDGRVECVVVWGLVVWWCWYDDNTGPRQQLVPRRRSRRW